MNYEIVNLEEKIVVGVNDVTGNNDPKIGEVIGSLWRKLYEDNIVATINNSVNDFSIGLYSDYKGDNYTVTVGKEVSLSDNPSLTTKIIPRGKYAKFSIHGHMVNDVAAAWGAIGSMDLDRSFTGDFEEYINSSIDEADVNIYIALNS